MKVLYYLISTIGNSITETLIHYLTNFYQLYIHQHYFLGPKWAQNTIIAVIMSQECSQTHGDCIKVDRSNLLRHHVTIVM